MTSSFEKITIIGLGLLGGSIGRSVKKYCPNIIINGYDHCYDTMHRAQEIGFIDYFHDDVTTLVKDADCVFLATPLSNFQEISKRIIPHMKQGAILTDTGSAKKQIIQEIVPFVTESIHFIPAHPIAGTEKQGVEAGFETLFQNKYMIFTPLPNTCPKAYDTLKTFWRNLEMIIEEMDVDHHDQVFAVVSHIPHLIAYNIVSTASDLEKVSKNEVIRFASSGFQDFTRLASSDPKVWRDVFIYNKDSVIEMLGRFIEDLFKLQKSIRFSDASFLEEYFQQAQEIRKKIFSQEHQS